MANRHRNKQLRRAARARMAATGESYQQARNSLLALRERALPDQSDNDAASSGADLMAIRYFGLPLALAAFPIAGRLSVLLLSGPHGRGPFPSNPLFGFGSALANH